MTYEKRYQIVLHARRRLDAQTVAPVRIVIFAEGLDSEEVDSLAEAMYAGYVADTVYVTECDRIPPAGIRVGTQAENEAATRIISNSIRHKLGLPEKEAVPTTKAIENATDALKGALDACIAKLRASGDYEEVAEPLVVARGLFGIGSALTREDFRAAWLLRRDSAEKYRQAVAEPDITEAMHCVTDAFEDLAEIADLCKELR